MLRVVSWAFVLAVTLFWTWAWFGPVGGFHHMIRFGLLGWGILDGEDGPAVLRWRPSLLAGSVAVWALGVGALAWFLRAVRPARGAATLSTTFVLGCSGAQVEGAGSTAVIDVTPRAPISTSVATAPALSSEERAQAIALAGRCGRTISRDHPIHALGVSKAPTFQGIVGPIQLEVSRDVDFARLAAFIQGFGEHGAGIEWVLRHEDQRDAQGEDGGAFFLSVEGQPERAPLVRDDACTKVPPGVWQLHVRGREARVRTASTPGTWADLAALDRTARDLGAGGRPDYVTLNATPATRAEIAALALATVTCAAPRPGDEELPVQLLLGELGCE